MEVSVCFKGPGITPAIHDKIMEKSKKLSKYYQNISSISWTCMSREDKKYTEVKMTGPRFEIYATSCSENLYKAFDLVTAKLERQLQRKVEYSIRGRRNRYRSVRDFREEDTLTYNVA